MITRDEYKEVTDVYPWGFKLPQFSLEEVQEFLQTLGYKIVIHKAPFIKDTYQQVDMEMENTGKREFFEPRILALKAWETFPERNDSEDAKSKDFHAVFNKEIKRKILGI